MNDVSHAAKLERILAKAPGKCILLKPGGFGGEAPEKILGFCRAKFGNS